MAQVNVDLRLRPIRFAFLIQPDNLEKVYEIFCINTCLWGGKFNPIIPILKNKRTHIINKYLNFFEPDFIVETENNLLRDINFDPARILKTYNLLEEEGVEYYENFGKHGQSIKSLYAELYETEFKFQQHNQHSTVYVETDNNHFKNFIACTFGKFPEQKKLKYFEKDYKNKFNPSIKMLSPYILNDLYKIQTTLLL